jgi:hypothetical protein
MLSLVHEGKWAEEGVTLMSPLRKRVLLVAASNGVAPTFGMGNLAQGRGRCSARGVEQMLCLGE